MRCDPTGGRIFTLTLAIAALAVTQTDAQQTVQDTQQLRRDMERTLGELAVNYWTPRLNDYKSRIDHMLGSPDLDDLNRLRVRYSLLTERLMQYRNQPAAMTPEVEGDFDLLFGEEALNDVEELMRIYKAAKDLAAKYRPELDGLRPSVIDDLTGFVEIMADSRQEFADEPAPAGNAGALRETARWLRSEEGGKSIAAVFDFAVEPVVMLYDGADLRNLFNQLGSSSSVIAGMELPEMSALRQNVPNPASSTTTIGYVLNEPGTGVIVRIFDARGDLKETFNQGSLSPGRHEVTVDVSSYPNGSYLYHLLVRTANGDRVYARTMQVVH